jgi:hypothetical protein
MLYDYVLLYELELYWNCTHKNVRINSGFRDFYRRKTIHIKDS